MEIIQDKALLLRLKNPQAVTAHIPNSRIVGKEPSGSTKVLVKWGLDEAQILSNLKIRNVPSPILRDYDWRGMYKPFDHQKTTASFLTTHKRAFCLNEQGTGKTGSVIWAADYLMRMGVIKRVLVICPLSIMDSAWRADLFKFAMHRKVDIAYGSEEKRFKIVLGDAEFIIINYDGVNIAYPAIVEAKFDLIVVDEANAYKNINTRRWKTLYKLLKPETWLWMLTGTPAAQSPLDAYALGKLVNPTGVPKIFAAYQDMVMYKLSRFRWEPKDNATDTVYRVLQPAIRFTKKECLDLPDIVYATRTIALTPQQNKYYETLRKQMAVNAAGEEITAVNAAVSLNKLLQISCGAAYTDSGETVTFDIKNRYLVLLEVVQEASNKVLLFVPFKHTIQVLRERLTEDGVPVEVIDGDVSVANRTRIFDNFQNTDNLKILIIQPQAAAHGVTLTAADTIVWWGPTPSMEIYAQANARAHRAGQTNKVTVVRLVGSNAERHIYKLLDSKINVHTQLVALYKEVLDKTI
ncbi:MAG: DEAD/DEAH box helicase [Betaproteobacteria bacterium]|nr:DEAD/DEAH box helicase [Betaproteobacteria bacterium]